MIPPQLALIAWIGVALWLFYNRRAYEAAVVSILGASLILPLRAGFDLPLVPLLDAGRIGILCAFVGVMLFARSQFRIAGKGHWLLILPALSMLAAFLTWATNRDPVSQGVRFLQGMGATGSLSLPVTQAIDLLIPFMIGLCLIRSPRAVKGFYAMLVGASLLYSVLVLYEVRMSPSLHEMFYGYRQSGFGQTRRFSGWRPVVFTEHGLALAMFMSTTVVAAAAAWRSKLRVFTLPGHVTFVYLAIVLVLCKSVAAIVYTAALAPLVVIAGPRTQVRVAALLAVIVLTYPVMRATDVFPTQPILSAAATIEKSGSLQFRFRNEDMLSERARERLLFGWGAWNRNRIFNHHNGEDISTTDGAWIIVFGQRGLFGFLVFFGALCAPIAMAMVTVSRLRSPVHRQLVAGLALLAALRAVDLLPNGFFMGPLTALISGSLGGACIGLRAFERKQLAARRVAAGGPAPDVGRGAETSATGPRAPAPTLEPVAPSVVSDGAGLGRSLRIPRPKR